jgi:hypothetical protein
MSMNVLPMNLPAQMGPVSRKLKIVQPYPRALLAISVKCPSGECVDAVENCPVGQGNEMQNKPPCPHFTCSDGSCARHWANCPTQKRCPPNRPILCVDGTCKSGIGSCGSSMSCTRVRCPSGDCVDAWHLCPTQTTCPKKICQMFRWYLS